MTVLASIVSHRYWFTADPVALGGLSVVHLDHLDVASLFMQHRTLGPCGVHLDTLQARARTGRLFQSWIDGIGGV